MASTAGVQQGDPLGPLLFALTIHPLVTALQQRNLELAFFYLDDGVLAGTAQEVSDALVEIQRAAAEVGLRLNLGKCELVAVGNTPEGYLAHLFPQEVLVVPSTGRSRVLREFQLLGVPAGGAGFCVQHTRGAGADGQDIAP